MSDLSPEVLVAGLPCIVAVMYLIKRLCAFDLEVRAHREHQRGLYEHERRVAAKHQRPSVAQEFLDQLVIIRGPDPTRPVEQWLLQSYLLARWRKEFGQKGIVPDETLEQLKQLLHQWAGTARYAAIVDELAAEGVVGADGRLIQGSLPEWFVRRSLPEWSGVRVDAGAKEPVLRIAGRGTRLSAPWQHRRVQVEIPLWALAFLEPEEAQRYARECAAHLHERIEHGELRAARVDRRGFVRFALVLAIKRRVRRAVSRSR